MSGQSKPTFAALEPSFVASLKAGETVLVMGAGGNLGTIGIQIAKNVIGAHVIAAAGSDDRVQLGLKLGADHGINYTTHNICDEVMRITNGKGVDLLYDNIANPKVLPSRCRKTMKSRPLVSIPHSAPARAVRSRLSSRKRFVRRPPSRRAPQARGEKCGHGGTGRRASLRC